MPGENSKHYDLEERTYEFARDVREFVRKLPRTLSNTEDAKQLVNSFGSVERDSLIHESIEPTSSFGAILRKSEGTP